MASKRIGLYGGTFDPPHVGHLACAEQTRQVFNLDEVWFIPTYQPVFKRGQFVTPANHRLRMVELSIQDNPFFRVDTIEIDRGGDTYTIETLRELTKQYPDYQFFFICGADAILTLPKWRNAQELVELAIFIGVDRPGSSSLVHSSAKTLLHDFSDTIQMIEIDAVDVSSSEVRTAIAKQKSISGMVPALVEDYIMTNKLYTPGFELSEFAYQKTDISDISFSSNPFSKENYEQMKALLKQRVKPSRFEHSVMVAKTAKKIAKAYGLDEDQAKMAGLLHDWDKALPPA
ncbi:MAG: nicotinate-nucleotide adenylyltransferase, partial [Anaerotardibacter sp.]